MKKTGPVAGAGEGLAKINNQATVLKPPAEKTQHESTAQSPYKPKALEFHPLADIFPPMEGAEFDTLVADIKANGLHESIVLYGRKILDGRNRYRAAQAAGVKLEYYHFIEFNAPHRGQKSNKAERDAAARAFVISKNIHRRHLSVEDRDRLIVQLLKADPRKSNRQVAKLSGTSHPHVAKVRERAEKTGDVETVTTSVDTKGRQQPAKKTPTLPPASRPTVSDAPVAAPETKRRTKLDREFDAGTFHRLEDERRHNAELAEKLRAAEIKIQGLESENGELKAERDRLRRSLDEALAANAGLAEVIRDGRAPSVAKLLERSHESEIADLPECRCAVPEEPPIASVSVGHASDGSVPKSVEPTDDGLGIPAFLDRAHPDCRLGKAGAS